MRRFGSFDNWQFAHSDDQATIRPGTKWMSQAEAEEARSRGT
jgi:hypothetical protein